MLLNTIPLSHAMLSPSLSSRCGSFDDMQDKLLLVDGFVINFRLCSLACFASSGGMNWVCGIDCVRRYEGTVGGMTVVWCRLLAVVDMLLIDQILAR